MKTLPKYRNCLQFFLLSDNCGGQNKNKTMTQFCCWFARTHNVTVTQLFPIRGHSFSVCYRNFGLIRTVLKKKKHLQLSHISAPWLKHERKTTILLKCYWTTHCFMTGKLGFHHYLDVFQHRLSKVINTQFRSMFC
ncbi:unnamed protein product [Psylliodes chrysocephalus]|uniref:Uncharacterized protein n=1 Tax=Psylliodes chrysocephalus TaxID=3402493 RepID=A0A9P0D2L1_9CUCU|nr:unnamed protein product [Psylliodes chrysocephala]